MKTTYIEYDEKGNLVKKGAYVNGKFVPEVPASKNHRAKSRKV